MRWRVVLASVCWLADPATAQPNDAARLFADARALKAAGNYDAACPLFEHSFALDHATGTELNLADCGEHFKRFGEALQLYRDAAIQYEREGKASSAQFARERARALAARLATVIVRTAQPAPPGFAVAIAGHAMPPAAEIHDFVEPGELEVTADAPGHVGFAVKKQAVAGATVEVDVPALAPVASERHDEPAVVATRRRRSRVHLAWALGGVALGSAIAGTALTLVGKSHYDTAADGADCYRTAGHLYCNAAGRSAIGSAQSLANLGTGFAIGAAILAGAGAYVYVSAPRDPMVGVAVAVRF